ncbi:MAG: diguanylate cyclase protein, partial [Nevskia sp.]|nr:diguanylate cyclase protein [Nevskia sp.]
MREPSTRLLTVSYVVALTLIATLSLASNLTFGRVLKQHQGSAAVINISGRQGMLSQRIASLASQLALGDTSVRTDLNSAIDQLERTANDLVNGDGKNLPALSPNVKSVYLDGKHPLYQQLMDYIGRARRIAAMQPSDPALPGELQPLLAAARKPLFTGLDVVVGLRELDSE